jgi:hypothetical protein
VVARRPIRVNGRRRGNRSLQIHPGGYRILPYTVLRLRQSQVDPASAPMASATRNTARRTLAFTQTIPVDSSHARSFPLGLDCSSRGCSLGQDPRSAPMRESCQGALVERRCPLRSRFLPQAQLPSNVLVLRLSGTPGTQALPLSPVPIGPHPLPRQCERRRSTHNSGSTPQAWRALPW